MRIFWALFGYLSLALGVIGIVVPLLPTTPFILLAAFAFAKSSPRMREKLIQSKIWGPIIKDWEKHHCIRRRVKVRATVVMLASITISFSVMTLTLFRVAVILSTISAVLLFIWTRKES